MRILFLISIIDEMTCGGAERFAAALACELSAQDHDVTVCATRYISEKYQISLQDAGVRTVTLGRRRKSDIHRIWRLRRILRDLRTEVVHSHMFGSNFWGALVGRVAGVPVVIAHEHTWAYTGNFLRKNMDGKIIGRLVDVFVAVSKDDARRMRDYEKVPAAKIKVFPTASVASNQIVQTARVRQELGLDTAARLVVNAAMMRPQKALHVLIRAFSEVTQVCPDAHLLLVGDGECRSMLENLTADLGLAANVHFMGVRDNVAGLLADADCAALSSTYEGMPLFVLESLAAGTRVVATDVGELRTLIREGTTGYLVPVGDAVALAGGILRVLQDESDPQFIETACKAVVAQLTVQAVASQFADLYLSCLAAKAQNGVAR